ncbi:MAG: IS3 family transposase [Erysipelotrichaceae bacterium]|nr:IS3 family transposase [Erysipelotrichaceae bacterium]
MKYMIIYDLKDKDKMKELCKLLKVSPSGYYRWNKLGRPIRYSFDEKVADLIEEIFYETYKGYRFIREQLKRRYGLVLNPKTVYRYMKIMNLSSPIRKKRFQCSTKEDTNEKARIVCDNVLARNFKASRPCEKLVTDVSYIHHQKGRMFLSVIKDLYDNSILAYNVSKFNDLKLVMDNVAGAITDDWNPTIPCVLHSDRGFQYTNILYVRFLDERGITVSHSRKANCYDNACCENFFSHIKSECLELFDLPEDEKSLIEAVDRYIHFYNYDRPQIKLKGMTPMEYRNAYLSKSK